MHLVLAATQILRSSHIRRVDWRRNLSKSVIAVSLYKKGISGDRVSWNIVNNRAQLYTFDPVTLKVDEEADYKLYMINPNYLDSYLQKN